MYVPAQAELALHKREGAAGRSLKPRGRAGENTQLPQGSHTSGRDTNSQTETDTVSEELATARREAEELSTSLAKASSVIEVCLVPPTLHPPPLPFPDLQGRACLTLRHPPCTEILQGEERCSGHECDTTVCSAGPAGAAVP